MIIANRIFNYSKWLFSEITAAKSNKAIHNYLASKNLYDPIIDYKTRVDFLRKAFSEFASSQNVLDLAVGTGAVIDALPNNRKRRITAVDVSDEMLNIAKKRFTTPLIRFIEKDFMNLTFPNNSFDLITISFATRFIPRGKEKEFAKNIQKWLTKNGVFVAIMMKSPEDEFYNLLYKITKTYPKGFNTEMESEHYFIKTLKPYLSFIKTEKLKRQLLVHQPIALYFKK